MTTTELTCPWCGGTDMEVPTGNRDGALSTMCLDCGADMLTVAASPGTVEFAAVRESRDAGFRAAGFSPVTVGHGRFCAGGREPVPVGAVAWVDADGWLWCRMHADAECQGR